MSLSRNLIRVLLAGSALFVAHAALAVSIIDQNQPSGPAYMAAFSQGDLAQSFQQSAGNVSGAGIFLQSGIGSSGTVTISLWDALPNNSGNMLATGSGTGTQGSWFDVFWSPVVVTPGNTLYLVFEPRNNGLGIAGDVNNPYALGQTYANPGFGTFPTFDYTFRTYAETNIRSVPDSASTLSLLGLAMLGVVWTRRQSKK